MGDWKRMDASQTQRVGQRKVTRRTAKACKVGVYVGTLPPAKKLRLAGMGETRTKTNDRSRTLRARRVIERERPAWLPMLVSLERLGQTTDEVGARQLLGRRKRLALPRDRLAVLS